MPTRTVLGAVHEHLPPKHDPFTDLVPPQGVRLTPRHYAYLKISEGCNNKCSFCIIPSMRGKLASRTIDDVLREGERLARAGVRELLVISQDTSAYGSTCATAGELARQRVRDPLPRPSRAVSASSASGCGCATCIRIRTSTTIPLMAEGKGAALPRRAVPARQPARC